jgi:hypothetical protein
MMRLQVRLHLLSLPLFTVKIKNFNILMRIYGKEKDSEATPEPHPFAFLT